MNDGVTLTAAGACLLGPGIVGVDRFPTIGKEAVVVGTTVVCAFWDVLGETETFVGTPAMGEFVALNFVGVLRGTYL